MKVFKSNEFVEKCRWLVTSVPNIYYSKNGTWDTYVDGKWRMDCVVSIKGLLWGFKADPSKPRGGAVYGSNGVADFGANAGINYCTEASQDFNHLVPGEYLCMKGTFHEHAGVYLGNGKVFECTTGWGARKCIISDIDNQGNRSYNGVKNLKWTWHGKLNYIDYVDTTIKSIDELAKEVIDGKWGTGEERKKRLTEAGYDYRAVQDRVNEICRDDNKKYIQINTKSGVWCRINGYGFNYPKYKVIPNKTKCELLQKDIGTANGYKWDKIIYNGKEVYVPNTWNKYL